MTAVAPAGPSQPTSGQPTLADAAKRTIRASREFMTRLAQGWASAGQLRPTRYLTATSLLIVATLALSFSFDLAVVSRFEYRAAQSRAYNRLRNELAHGIAPIGQLDKKGRLVSVGAPVALMLIPALHLRTVVLEGTTPAVMTSGPGHLRNTVLPGQVGTSVVFGRAAGYGGPFGSIQRLHRGDKITVTTGNGVSDFAVVDIRQAGDPIPPLADAAARLTLVTATGVPFFPSGVVRVDADTSATGHAAASLAVANVPRSELPMGTDARTLWELAFLLEGLILAALGAVWAWRRWGRAQTWIVFFPLIVLLAYYVSDQAARLLPNLM